MSPAEHADCAVVQGRAQRAVLDLELCDRSLRWCSSGADDWADVLKCAEHVSGWEVRDMSEPLLVRALGTNDGATDVLIVSDVVFAEQLASVC